MCRGMEPKRTTGLRDPCGPLRDSARASKMPFKMRGGGQTPGVAPPCAAFVVALAQAFPAGAQARAEFYRGRTVELDISTSVGGGYDPYAPLLARHIARFFPGTRTTA